MKKDRKISYLVIFILIILWVVLIFLLVRLPLFASVMPAGPEKSGVAVVGSLPIQPADFPALGTQAWGALAGWKIPDISYFEETVGKKTQMLEIFIHWGNEKDFPSYLGPLVKADDKTLVIYWEALDYNIHSSAQPQFSYDAILRGDWDSYLTSFAQSAKDYAWPVILIPFSEMNGDWYPWSVSQNGNSAQKHIQAYRYVHEFFKDADNVRFGWVINVNNTPSLASQIKLFYPGDQYVDYVGTDGFNANEPWLSFNQVFDKTIKGLATLNKPIYIFALASAAGPAKAGWIADAFKQIASQPAIKGWIWFNENKEKDWRVWSDANSLVAFKTSLP